jgi:topoisomerase IV subunit A
VYTLLGHVLPSARGQGEPLTGKLNPAEGASFAALTSGEPDDWVLLSNDAGYGFLTQLKELYVKNRNGKACLKLPTNSQILPPRMVANRDIQQVACATNTGRLLIFAVNELPELSRGKGNKLINVPSAKAAQREEFVIDVQVLAADDALTVHAGKRHFTLKAADLAHYQAERGRRGNRLPRGLQNVTGLEVGKT